MKTRGRLKTLSLYKEMFYKTLQEELTWNIKSETCDIKMTKCCKISYNPIQSAINIGSEVAIKEEFFVFSPFSEICGSCGCLRCGAVAGFCEAQARVRQGSARDGSQGERPQSLNPCLELTLKLVATFPPPTTHHPPISLILLN